MLFTPKLAKLFEFHERYVTETNKVYSVSPSIISKYKLSGNDDLLCVCLDKDVYSSDSVQSDINCGS